MTSTLSAGIGLVVSSFQAMVDFCFNTVHPGFTTITIGAVLSGIFMLSLGFDYLDFFLGSNHVRGDKKK